MKRHVYRDNSTQSTVHRPIVGWKNLHQDGDHGTTWKPSCLWCLDGRKKRWTTPLKTNMEPQNWVVCKCFSFSKGVFSVSMLGFGEVHEAETSDHSLTHFATQLEQKQLLQFLGIPLYGYVTCVYIYIYTYYRKYIHYILWECRLLLWSGEKTTQLNGVLPKFVLRSLLPKPKQSQTDSSIMN